MVSWAVESLSWPAQIGSQPVIALHAAAKGCAEIVQVLRKHAAAERLPGDYPPVHYYQSALELPEDIPSTHSIVRGSRHHRPMIDRSRERS